MTTTRVVVLISGQGSNLRAIYDAAQRGEIPIELSGVVSNNPHAEGVAWARRQTLPVAVIDHRLFASRGAFDQALATRIDAWSPNLVILAGFMRILGADFIRRYEDRLLNIHPALLPDLPGLDTHARALASGKGRHGATVHFVRHEVDAGPIVAQASVPIRPDDTPATLAARVLEQEHLLFPRVIGWFAQHRLAVHDGRVFLDGRPVTLEMDGRVDSA